MIETLVLDNNEGNNVNETLLGKILFTADFPSEFTNKFINDGKSELAAISLINALHEKPNISSIRSLISLYDNYPEDYNNILYSQKELLNAEARSILIAMGPAPQDDIHLPSVSQSIDELSILSETMKNAEEAEKSSQKAGFYPRTSIGVCLALLVRRSPEEAQAFYDLLKAHNQRENDFGQGFDLKGESLDLIYEINPQFAFNILQNEISKRDHDNKYILSENFTHLLKNIYINGSSEHKSYLQQYVESDIDEKINSFISSKVSRELEDDTGRFRNRRDTKSNALLRNLDILDDEDMINVLIEQSPQFCLDQINRLYEIFTTDSEITDFSLLYSFELPLLLKLYDRNIVSAELIDTYMRDIKSIFNSHLNNFFTRELNIVTKISFIKGIRHTIQLFPDELLSTAKQFLNEQYIKINTDIDSLDLENNKNISQSEIFSYVFAENKFIHIDDITIAGSRLEPVNAFMTEICTNMRKHGENILVSDIEAQYLQISSSLLELLKSTSENPRQPVATDDANLPSFKNIHSWMTSLTSGLEMCIKYYKAANLDTVCKFGSDEDYIFDNISLLRTDNIINILSNPSLSHLKPYFAQLALENDSLKDLSFDFPKRASLIIQAMEIQGCDFPYSQIEDANGLAKFLFMGLAHDENSTDFLNYISDLMSENPHFSIKIIEKIQTFRSLYSKLGEDSISVLSEITQNCRDNDELSDIYIQSLENMTMVFAKQIWELNPGANFVIDVLKIYLLKNFSQEKQRFNNQIATELNEIMLKSISVPSQTEKDFRGSPKMLPLEVQDMNEEQKSEWRNKMLEEYYLKSRYALGAYVFLNKKSFTESLKLKDQTDEKTSYPKVIEKRTDSLITYILDFNQEAHEFTRTGISNKLIRTIFSLESNHQTLKILAQEEANSDLIEYLNRNLVKETSTFLDKFKDESRFHSVQLPFVFERLENELNIIQSLQEEEMCILPERSIFTGVLNEEHINKLKVLPSRFILLRTADKLKNADVDISPKDQLRTALESAIKEAESLQLPSTIPTSFTLVINKFYSALTQSGYTQEVVGQFKNVYPSADLFTKLYQSLLDFKNAKTIESPKSTQSSTFRSSRFDNPANAACSKFLSDLADIIKYESIDSDYLVSIIFNFKIQDVIKSIIHSEILEATQQESLLSTIFLHPELTDKITEYAGVPFKQIKESRFGVNTEIGKYIIEIMQDEKSSLNFDKFLTSLEISSPEIFKFLVTEKRTSLGAITDYIFTYTDIPTIDGENFTIEKLISKLNIFEEENNLNLAQAYFEKDEIIPTFINEVIYKYKLTLNPNSSDFSSQFTSLNVEDMVSIFEFIEIRFNEVKSNLNAETTPLDFINSIAIFEKLSYLSSALRLSEATMGANHVDLQELFNFALNEFPEDHPLNLNSLLKNIAPSGILFKNKFGNYDNKTKDYEISIYMNWVRNAHELKNKPQQQEGKNIFISENFQLYKNKNNLKQVLEFTTKLEEVNNTLSTDKKEGDITRFLNIHCNAITKLLNIPNIKTQQKVLEIIVETAKKQGFTEVQSIFGIIDKTDTEAINAIWDFVDVLRESMTGKSMSEISSKFQITSDTILDLIYMGYGMTWFNQVESYKDILRTTALDINSVSKLIKSQQGNKGQGISATPDMINSKLEKIQSIDMVLENIGKKMLISYAGSLNVEEQNVRTHIKEWDLALIPKMLEAKSKFGGDSEKLLSVFLRTQMQGDFTMLTRHTKEYLSIRTWEEMHSKLYGSYEEAELTIMKSIFEHSLEVEKMYTDLGIDFETWMTYEEEINFNADISYETYSNSLTTIKATLFNYIDDIEKHFGDYDSLIQNLNNNHPKVMKEFKSKLQEKNPKIEPLAVDDKLFKIREKIYTDLEEMGIYIDKESRSIFIEEENIRREMFVSDINLSDQENFNIKSEQIKKLQSALLKITNHINTQKNNMDLLRSSISAHISKPLEQDYYKRLTDNIDSDFELDYDHLEAENKNTLKYLRKLEWGHLNGNYPLQILHWNKLPPGYNIFQGNYSHCCIAVNSGNKGVILKYLTDPRVMILPIIDQTDSENGKPHIVGQAFVFLAKDKEDKLSLIVDNIEINAQYFILQKQIADNMLTYLEKFASDITANSDTIIENIELGSNYNDISVHNFPLRENIWELLLSKPSQNIFTQVYLDAFGGHNHEVKVKAKTYGLSKYKQVEYKSKKRSKRTIYQAA